MRGLFLIVLMMALAAWSPTSARDMRMEQMAMAAIGANDGMHLATAPCHDGQADRGLDAACCAVSAGIPTHVGPGLAAAERLFAPIGPAEIQAGRATPPAIPPPKV